MLNSSQTLTIKDSFSLRGGQSLDSMEIAWTSFGELNASRSNAVLVCHALTGDQFVTGTNPRTGRAGWWSDVVGPSRPIDTDKYFVICANVLGGCSGSTGPSSLDPATGKPYAMTFPVVTIDDMVNAQMQLVDHLRINKLAAVVGGSMGGMQAMQLAVKYPSRVKSCIAIATSPRHSPQNIAFHELGRQAVMADPQWNEGNYPYDNQPKKGLAVARMAAHITYMSEEYLHSKFGRNLQNRDEITFGFDADFQVESYLRHQGHTFVDRFDANSYLYITRAMDYFDLAADTTADPVASPRLSDAFVGTSVRFCVISFTSDWLFPTSEAKAIVRALNAVAADVSFVEIDAPSGHDSFLLKSPDMHRTIAAFLGSN